MAVFWVVFGEREKMGGAHVGTFSSCLIDEISVKKKNFFGFSLPTL